MEKKDKLTIIIFVILVISIITLAGINYYKNRPLENVDRKIEYIMGYSYDTVLNKGESLFEDTIELLINPDIFDYAKNTNGKITFYSINKVNTYKKIKNFSIVKNILNEDSLKKYMTDKNIIYYEDSYYINDEEFTNTNYIGSIIDILSYDDKKVTFSSVNYYCNNTKYIGILEEEPNCNYEIKKTNFNIDFIDNTFRISNIEEFKQIINK